MPLKIIRRASSGALTISGTIAGRQFRRRAQSNDIRLAREEAAALEAESLRIQWHGERRGVRTFAEAAVSYLKAEPRSESTITYIEKIGDVLGETSLAE